MSRPAEPRGTSHGPWPRAVCRGACDRRPRQAGLLVDPTLGGVERTRRRVDRPLAERMHETDQCAGVLDRGRLVRSTNLERSEPRMWADVPPEARVVARQAGRHHPLDETLP